MAFTSKRIDVLKIPLESKPGSFAKVYRAFREAGVDVNATWGYQMGPDAAEANIFPKDINKAKAALDKIGVKSTPNQAVWIDGKDEIGVYLEALDKLEKANVSIEASDAFGVGGRFACVMFFDDKNREAGCKALGC
jgi:hypothetical protein